MLIPNLGYMFVQSLLISRQKYWHCRHPALGKRCKMHLQIKIRFFRKSFQKLKSKMTKCKLHYGFTFVLLKFFLKVNQLRNQIQTAKYSPVAGSTLHTEHCTLHATHCTCTWSCTCTCTCTFHTTHWTLHTAYRMFILPVAHLSLHTANIQNLP